MPVIYVWILYVHMLVKKNLVIGWLHLELELMSHEDFMVCVNNQCYMPIHVGCTNLTIRSRMDWIDSGTEVWGSSSWYMMMTCLLMFVLNSIFILFLKILKLCLVYYEPNGHCCCKIGPDINGCYTL